MRCVLSFILMIICIASASAQNLNATLEISKDNNHVGMNPGTPDGRDGGEDMASAIIIATLPFADTGNTTDNLNDYDAVCPYTGSTAPDVVYSYTPTADEAITVDMCGSGYDTKIYIMDGDQNIIACNDDAYFYGDICGQYVSMIEGAELIGGTEYFLVIDGYGEDAGDFILDMKVFIAAPPCFLNCQGGHECEPALGPEYEDSYNGGCNSPDFGNPFHDLTWAADAEGNLTLCAKSGWFIRNQSPHRDTDWSLILLGEDGLVEWTLDAEYPVHGFLLGGDCTYGITIEDELTSGPCSPQTMIIQGDPYDLRMIWVGPTENTPPDDFVGYEFNYISTFTGLWGPDVFSVSKTTLGSLKSLYR